MPNHMVILCLIFFRNCHNFFTQWLPHFTSLPAVDKGFSFSTSSPTLAIFYFFGNSHPNACEVVSLWMDRVFKLWTGTYLPWKCSKLGCAQRTIAMGTWMGSKETGVVKPLSWFWPSVQWVVDHGGMENQLCTLKSPDWSNYLLLNTSSCAWCTARPNNMETMKSGAEEGLLQGHARGTGGSCPPKTQTP